MSIWHHTISLYFCIKTTMFMKHIRLFVLAALAIICSATLSAQTAEEYLYVNLDDQPDATYFLPPPPSIGRTRRVCPAEGNGRRVYGQPSGKGIYISDGKKVVN